MRIAKFLSKHGLCSRRTAEQWVIDGRVKIDGRILFSPAVNVSPSNIVKVDDKLVLSDTKPRLWLYNKPVGLITTYNDPFSRRTVFSQLRNLGLPRVISVGRLDINSEGLLLLTNSGELSHYLEQPKNQIIREYKVRAHGKTRLSLHKQSITIDKIVYYVKLIQIIKSNITNSWYKVVLSEGKNREVRKIFKHFGLEVNRLIRVRYGDYRLGNIRSGEIEEVKISENYFRKIQEQ